MFSVRRLPSIRAGRGMNGARVDHDLVIVGSGFSGIGMAIAR